MKLLFFILLFIFSTSDSSFADENGVLLKASRQQKTWDLTSEQQTRYSNLSLFVAPTIISFYGITSWGWIGHGMKFNVRNEKWFQRNTYVGGADKLSHAYSHFLITRGYYDIFLRMGLSPEEANLKSMIGGSITGLVIELGDGVSHYGFSWEDLISDVVGIGFAGLLNAYPHLDELIGFQIQWWPQTAPAAHPNQKLRSPIDDYNNQKYAINLRASGIRVLNEYWYTRYLNLDFGYYSRGYKADKSNPGSDPDLFGRNLFIGMSINLSKLFEPRSLLAGTVFKYYQTPFNAVDLHRFPLQ